MNKIILILALVLMHLTAVGQPIDAEKAEQGDICEQIKMGDFYFSHTHDGRNNIAGIIFHGLSSYGTGKWYKWYSRAAASGSFVANVKLGLIHLLLRLTDDRNYNTATDELQKAKNALLKALSIYPNVLDADKKYMAMWGENNFVQALYYGLGCYYWRCGDFTTAASYLKKLADTDGSSKAKCYGMILLVKYLGHKQYYDDAVIYCGRVIKTQNKCTNDTFEMACFYLGTICYHKGNKARAYELWQLSSYWRNQYEHHWDKSKGDFPRHSRNNLYYQLMSDAFDCGVHGIHYKSIAEVLLLDISTFQ